MLSGWKKELGRLGGPVRERKKGPGERGFSYADWGKRGVKKREGGKESSLFRGS